MNNISKVKEKCNGCIACYNICPVKAIELQHDNLGFVYPFVNDNLCVNCGKCIKTCSIENPFKFSNESTIFGMKDNLEKNNNSSTIGIISSICEKLLLNNWVVVAPAFDDEFNLKYIDVKKSDLNKIAGSKYLQADLRPAYGIINRNLNNKKILFIGTPCYVSAIKKFYNNSENIYCIDIFCHGVPSNHFFKTYLKYIENKEKSKVTSYKFRNNSKKWWGNGYYYIYETENGKKKSSRFQHDKYGYAFFNNESLRYSCYKCNFKTLNRPGDISFGDYWGVFKDSKEKYSKNGVELCIISSQKGFELISYINKYTKFEVDVEKIHVNNGALKSDTKEIPELRKTIELEFNNNFFKNYQPNINMKKKILEYLPNFIVINLKFLKK